MAHRRLSPIDMPSDPLPPAAVDPTTWGPLLRALYRHARCLGARGEEAEDLVHDVMERYCRDALDAGRIWLDVYEDNAVGIHIYEKMGYARFKAERVGARRLFFYEKRLDD